MTRGEYVTRLERVAEKAQALYYAQVHDAPYAIEELGEALDMLRVRCDRCDNGHWPHCPAKEETKP